MYITTRRGLCACVCVWACVCALACLLLSGDHNVPWIAAASYALGQATLPSFGRSPKMPRITNNRSSIWIPFFFSSAFYAIQPSGSYTPLRATSSWFTPPNISFAFIFDEVWLTGRLGSSTTRPICHLCGRWPSTRERAARRPVNAPVNEDL